MKELILFIILLFLFGCTTSKQTDSPQWHLLYEHPNPDLAYKSISIEDWPKEFCEEQL